MAAITLILVMLAIQHSLKHKLQIDMAMTQQMQEREKYLQQEMTRLLQEIEQSSGAQEATFLAVLWQWPFRSITGALVLLAVAFWLAKKVKLISDSWSEQDSSSSEEEETDIKGVHGIVRSLAMFTPSPTQDLPNECKVLKELVGDLLGVCRVLCKSTFMPQMHPATGVDGICETWNVQEKTITYRLLVFLQPPPGHAFSLEPDTAGQLPARPSSIHVLLECTCSWDRLLGHMLCFLHQPEDRLRREESSFLLRTLCTDSYLDVEKIACWVQVLVPSAWLLMPQSHHCQLTLLPSSQGCRFQLTSTSEMTICTEMTFAVPQGSSGAYLSLA